VASSASAPAIIPLPQKIEGRAGEFKLLPATRILADASSTGTGDYLAERLRKSTGYPLKVEALTSARIPEQSIVLTTKDAKAYELTVARDSVVIRASDQAGLFYGVQTLLQLLPPEVFVPQIEMPAHTPEFSCFGGPYNTEPDAKPPTGAVYCVGSEETFEFLQNVLAEVIALFPGRYIHIGGDEVNKENWKRCAKCQDRMRAEGLKTEHGLQSYFIRRIERFMTSRDRTLIGWSEISEGGLAQHTAMMDWIGGAVEAASAGHDLVMSPTN
jgi:N-acetyl-beta-hexosaminidase